MMLGPAENHSSDSFRMLNIATRKVIITRDILWLNKLYGSYYQTIVQDYDIDHDTNNFTQVDPSPDNVPSYIMDEANESSSDEDNDDNINNTNNTLDQPPATPIPEAPDIVDDNATMEEVNAPTVTPLHACYHQVLLFQVPPNQEGI